MKNPLKNQGPVGIGVVGCGNIAPSYLRNAKAFQDIEIIGVADLNDELATARSTEYEVEKIDLESMLKRDDIQIILNITPPNAHAAVTRAALAAGKHVYSEKPLATSFKEGQALKEEAEKAGVQICVAPDTFLGASHQMARRMIDDGEIGRIVGGVTFYLNPGMESWHPNPDFFFKKGGGPLFDMAPYYITLLVNLLGPVDRVTSMAATPRTTRTVTAEGAMKGKDINVEVPTTYWSILSFKSGAQVSLGIGWDVAIHSLPHMELYGSEGSIRMADPDQFGGAIHVGKAGKWTEYKTEGKLFGGPEGKWTDHRSLGIVDMVMAMRQGREPQTSVRRALHVLETIDALTLAAESGSAVALTTSFDRSARLESSKVGLR